MFYVVEFTNGSVEVVPDNWLLDKGHSCYWPPLRAKNIMIAIREKRNPELSWKKTQIKKVMRKCATFAIADKKAETARFTSDLSTTDINTDANADVEMPPEGKRMTKRPLSYSPEQDWKHEHTTKQKNKEKSTAALPDALPSLPALPSELAELSVLSKTPVTSNSGCVDDMTLPADTSVEQMLNENENVQPEHDNRDNTSSHRISMSSSVKGRASLGRQSSVSKLSIHGDTSVEHMMNENENIQPVQPEHDNHDNASSHRTNMYSVEGRASMGRQSTVTIGYQSELKLVLSKFNRMDEKIDHLNRKLRFLKQDKCYQ